VRRGEDRCLKLVRRHDPIDQARISRPFRVEIASHDEQLER
jgi:hypothetical protein